LFNILFLIAHMHNKHFAEVSKKRQKYIVLSVNVFKKG